MLRFIKMLTLVGTLTLLNACADGPPDDDDGSDSGSAALELVPSDNSTLSSSPCQDLQNGCQSTAE